MKNFDTHDTQFYWETFIDDHCIIQSIPHLILDVL